MTFGERAGHAVLKELIRDTFEKQTF